MTFELNSRKVIFKLVKLSQGKIVNYYYGNTLTYEIGHYCCLKFTFYFSSLVFVEKGNYLFT